MGRPAGFQQTEETKRKLSEFYRKKREEKPKRFCNLCGNEIVSKEAEARYCSRSCSARVSNSHRRPHTEETRNKIKEARKKQICSKRHPDKTVNCKTCKAEFVVTWWSKRQFCTHTCSHLGKKKAGGGLRKGSGRGKHGWYKGYYCDSTWELAYVIWALDHNINFERNKKSFEYEWNGKIHKYYPDFFLPDTQQYLEIKGYHTDQVKAKFKAVEVVLIGKAEIKPYLEYAQKKFNTKNLAEVYESKP